jgi:hypothetical protein
MKLKKDIWLGSASLSFVFVNLTTMQNMFSIRFVLKRKTKNTTDSDMRTQHGCPDAIRLQTQYPYLTDMSMAPSSLSTQANLLELPST